MERRQGIETESHVVEEGYRGGRIPIEHGHPAVHRGAGGILHRPDGILWPGWVSESVSQVVAGSHRNDSQSGVCAGFQKTQRDFVDRSVTSDRDHGVPVGQLPRKLRGMPPSVGHSDFHRGGRGSSEQRANLVHSPADSTVRGSRIDDCSEIHNDSIRGKPNIRMRFRFIAVLYLVLL